MNYSNMTIAQLAQVIRCDWKTMTISAWVYVKAMKVMNSITDNYDADSGTSIVARFLSNAQCWRGEVARAVKAELNKRLKAEYKKK